MGFTRSGGGSCLLYPCNWRCNRKSSRPEVCSRGSECPSEAKVWPTERKASSTVLALTLALEGANVPTRYREANIWSSGTGSSMSARKGSQAKSLQKVSQIRQPVAWDPDRPSAVLLAAAALIAPSSSWRLCCWAGSQDAKVAGQESVVAHMTVIPCQTNERSGTKNQREC